MKSGKVRTYLRVDPETERKLKAAFVSSRIELASTDRIDALTPYVHKVLTVIGHSDALVTDESTFGDFGSDAELSALTVPEFGSIVRSFDKIVNFAEALKKREQDPTPNLEDSPYTDCHFKFVTEKWDTSKALTAILTFVERMGLDAKCSAWLDKHWPAANP